MKLNDVQRIHMIGIGGIGMSALARFFLHEKKEVSGSDRAPSAITEALESEGVRFFDTQTAATITDDIDLVVYTEAMPEDHPELTAAREQGIETLNYFEALGVVANEYYLIAVAGTHGKTTTTAMLTDVLEEASFDPTAIIGSLRAKTGSNFRAGKSKYCVVEACEYRRDFLSLTPDLLVITNIEAEHLDYYRDLADVQDAFRELASRVRDGGTIVANLSDPQVGPAIEVVEKTEGTSLTIVDYTKHLDPLLQLTQPGLHNQMNAAAALAAAATLGVEKKIAKSALEHFAGTWRRFEYKGEVGGAPVYDDYAHHPTEVRATLQGVREHFPAKRIVLIFQPHLASRTEKLFDDFVDALSGADELILAPTYAARKQDQEGVGSDALAEAIREKNQNTHYIETFDDIVARIKETAGENDLVLVMGAGDVTEIASRLVA